MVSTFFSTTCEDFSLLFIAGSASLLLVQRLAWSGLVTISDISALQLAHLLPPVRPLSSSIVGEKEVIISISRVL